jgi:hypothetical protein
MKYMLDKQYYINENKRNPFTNFIVLQFIKDNKKPVYFPIFNKPDSNNISFVPPDINPNFYSSFMYGDKNNMILKSTNELKLILQEIQNSIDITKLKTTNQFKNYCKSNNLISPSH